MAPIVRFENCCQMSALNCFVLTVEQYQKASQFQVNVGIQADNLVFVNK